jgi:hypothetical protein
VAPVQASVPDFSGWLELRSAESERRHFARHRLIAWYRAVQAGDAILGSLKPSDTGALFNHVVGQQKEFARNRQVGLFRCLRIDDQLELGRLLDRQLGGLCAFENLIDEDCGLPRQIGQIDAVGRQAADIGEFPSGTYRLQPIGDRINSSHCGN